MDKFNLDIPRMGYIIAVKIPDKPDWISKGIYKEQIEREFSEEEASFVHVVISGGGPDIVNIQPPKARLRNLIQAYSGRYIKILRIKNNADYEKRARYKIGYFAATLCDKPYDIFGVLRFKLGLFFGFSNAYFCSEGSLWAIRKERPYFMKRLKEYDCMPAHFIKSDELETVWEGVIE